MNFADYIREDKKWTKTENGAICKNTTDCALLDLFSTIGSLRTRSSDDIINKFILAYNEDRIGALRCLFYSRDIRGGLGERRTFRIIYNYLGNFDPEFVSNYLELIPEMGRYDDFYSLMGTKAEDDMWAYVKEQLMLDKKSMEEGRSCSLLAKWLKKADSKSKLTKMLGIYTANHLEMSVYDYKRLCNKLRKYIDVVEVKMSKKEWDLIEYSKVPSRAMLNYRNAFDRHDNDRYHNYIDEVVSGKSKINTSTLFPYDIVLKYFNGAIDESLDILWSQLPDYIEGNNNILVMSDVSYSMETNGRMPLASSIGLAIYFAERNKGAYHNLFMTFSRDPEIISLDGLDNVGICDKIRFVEKSNWDNSTNLIKVFRKVLTIAVNNNIPKHEMPKAILVVSDMEIDRADFNRKETFAKSIKSEFERYGYENPPKIVFWNVNSRKETFLADSNDKNTILVSGQSASTFKNLIKCLDKSPIEMMYEILNCERYAIIK